MFILIGIVSFYLLMLQYLIKVGGLHTPTIMSTVIIILTAILVSYLISRLSSKLRFGFIIFFVIITSFLTFGNIFYFYVKNSILTISLVKLLNELVGVSDSVSGYLQPQLVIILIIPVIFILIMNMAAQNVTTRFSSNILLLVTGCLIIINIGFYQQDRLLYTSIYSPVEYAKSFGLISFYAREFTPLPSLNFNDVEYENNAIVNQTNEYSNLFKDKSNVVMVTAESFDDIAIDSRLTPTLYKMSTDGIFFENYYTLSDNTNASEFSIMSSIHPPVDASSLEKFNADYDTIVDLFNKAGYCSQAFHYNSGEFYKRNIIYDEMYHFSESYFSDDLGEVEDMNGVLDQLLFEKSTYFIEESNCEKNFTYYMSFYGHSPYEPYTRVSSKENYHKVENIYPNIDGYLNAYLTYQMSLDQMLEEMIEYYDLEGVLDQTIFIVVADHYPYALGDLEHPYGEYSKSFVEQSFDGSAFETYNVPFMIYDPTNKLDNNSKYISNIDVMPTIADLFGFDYQYAEGNSAFDESTEGVIKWLGVDNFGVLADGFVYKDDGTTELNTELSQQLESDKLTAAKIYSLFN